MTIGKLAQTAIVALGVFSSGCLSPVLAGPEEGHHHPSHDHSDHHEHSVLEINDSEPLPAVTVRVEPDLASGWNLKVEVVNFEFAPERVNQESVPYEGHAHLYINGEKVARLYGPWYHIPHLEPGSHEIQVTLNANGHEALVYEGEAIADTVRVWVAEDHPE
jgi:hypothetical protein